MADIAPINALIRTRSVAIERANARRHAAGAAGRSDPGSILSAAQGAPKADAFEADAAEYFDPSRRAAGTSTVFLAQLIAQDLFGDTIFVNSTLHAHVAYRERLYWLQRAFRAPDIDCAM